MKKINIQRDVESRRNIAGTISTTESIKQIVETVIVEDDGESKIKQGDADDTSTAATEKPKKGRRSSKGDVQEVSI